MKKRLMKINVPNNIGIKIDKVMKNAYCMIEMSKQEDSIVSDYDNDGIIEEGEVEVNE